MSKNSSERGGVHQGQERSRRRWGANALGDGAVPPDASPPRWRPCSNAPRADAKSGGGGDAEVRKMPPCQAWRGGEGVSVGVWPLVGPSGPEGTWAGVSVGFSPSRPAAP